MNQSIVLGPKQYNGKFSLSNREPRRAEIEIKSPKKPKLCEFKSSSHQTSTSQTYNPIKIISELDNIGQPTFKKPQLRGDSVASLSIQSNNLLAVNENGR